MRSGSDIKMLAYETVDKIKKSGYLSELDKHLLNELLDCLGKRNCQDKEVMETFHAVTLFEGTASRLLIATVKDFLVKAQRVFLDQMEQMTQEKAILESQNNQFKSRVEFLGKQNECLTKTKSGLNEYIESNKNILIESAVQHNGKHSFFQRFQYENCHERQILNAILILLGIRELETLCVTSKFLNTVILDMKLKYKAVQFSPFYQGNSFEMFYKNLSGKMITLVTDEDNTVHHLKKMVQYKEGIFTSQQRLIFAGQQLEDHQTLKDKKIGEHSTIHLVLGLRGD